MYTVFLTGGIGSGKSAVCDLLHQRGARVVDLDDIAHEVLQDPQVKLELARRFGEDVLDWPEGFETCWIGAGAGKIDAEGGDGAARCLDPSVACTIVEASDPLDDMCLGTGDFAVVNRARLAERAFATPEATADLNAITHPRIFARLGDVLTGTCCMGSREKVTVVEVPLIESCRDALVLADEVVTVSCPVELRRERAVARGMGADDFDGRVARQATDEQRERMADTVIVNDGDRKALEIAVDAWWARREAEGWRIGVPGPRSDVPRPSAGADGGDRPIAAAGPGLKSPAIAFVGRHNSGKTTLVVSVIAALAARGVDVASVKHHGHRGFDVDVPGKDSWRHREAGANEVAVCSPDKLALIRELDDQMEASEIVGLMRVHDVVVVEGYRHSGIPTIEIMRSGNERDALAAREFVRAVEAGGDFAFDPAALGRDADRMPDGLTVGVASDMPDVLAAARACGLQAFDLNDPDAIAAYIEREVVHARAVAPCGAQRVEHDSMGEVSVPADALWGAQTQRSYENFAIGTETMPLEVVRAFALLKKAAAQANAELGVLPARAASLIEQAADEVLAGAHDAEFPLKVWQTGSGTQSNMNMNEVLANRGNQIAAAHGDPSRPLHPNDSVNRSQSSNDTFPTALHVAAVLAVKRCLLPAIDGLVATLRRLEAENAGVVKCGRTHLQDAVPISFSEEISGWRGLLENARGEVEASLAGLYRLALGGTAVGTGLNAPEGFAELVARKIADLTGEPFVSDPNKYAALSGKDAAVFSHGALKALAANLMKVANDVRWLASGPRLGLGEITIPANEPGSSIMPGKVNPTQCEALTMVAVQVMGNDAAIGFAASQGNFELNVFMPVIAYNYLQSVRLLADGIRSFDERCAAGIKANRGKMDANLHDSLMLVTCLNPHIGYENAAKVAKKAYAEGTSLKEACVALGFLTAQRFDEVFKPEEMV